MALPRTPTWETIFSVNPLQIDHRHADDAILLEGAGRVGVHGGVINSFNRMADSKQVDLACLAEECDYVRFTVADLNGIPRSKTVPRRHAAQALRDGLAIFGGTVYIALEFVV